METVTVYWNGLPYTVDDLSLVVLQADFTGTRFRPVLLNRENFEGMPIGRYASRNNARRRLRAFQARMRMALDLYDLAPIDGNYRASRMGL